MRRVASATSLPWPSVTRIVGRAGSRPSSAAASSRPSSCERSTRTIGSTRWARSRTATVGPASSDSASSPGSSTASKAPSRPSGHAARAPLPQRPPAPDRDALRPQRAEQGLVRVGAVEDDQGGVGLGDRRPQAAAQASRPPVVVAGARRRVRGDVLDRESHPLHHRRGGRERQEERFDPGVQAAGDRHRARQVPEPGAVGGGEEDPAPRRRRAGLAQRPDDARVRS